MKSILKLYILNISDTQCIGGKHIIIKMADFLKSYFYGKKDTVECLKYVNID